MRLMVLLLLLVPNVAAANLFTYYNESDYGYLFLGDTITGYVDHAHDGYAELRGPLSSAEITGGWLELTESAVQATWLLDLPNSGTHTVLFSADLVAWDPIDQGDGFVTFTNGRVWGAEFLGVTGDRLSGWWSLYLDYNDEDVRLYGVIEATAVPEPGIALLLLAGLAGRRALRSVTFPAPRV
jgi:hypothetical protein